MPAKPAKFQNRQYSAILMACIPGQVVMPVKRCVLGGQMFINALELAIAQQAISTFCERCNALKVGQDEHIPETSFEIVLALNDQPPTILDQAPWPSGTDESVNPLIAWLTSAIETFEATA